MVAASRRRSSPGLIAIVTHARAVRAMGFSPHGRVLASGSDDKTVTLWDVADAGHPVGMATLAEHSGAVRTLGFSPNGRLLATGGRDKNVIMWDVTDAAQPTRTATLTEHSGAVDAWGSVLMVGCWPPAMPPSTTPRFCGTSLTRRTRFGPPPSCRTVLTG